MELVSLFITSFIVNNIIFMQFLGTCPFLGVSKQIDTAAGMGIAVIFVITLASVITYIIHYAILVSLGLEYLQTIVFILIIAALVMLKCFKNHSQFYEHWEFPPLLQTVVLGVIIMYL